VLDKATKKTEEQRLIHRLAEKFLDHHRDQNRQNYLETSASQRQPLHFHQPA
jgi:hypothetical protein